MANQTNININVKVDDKQVGNAVKSTENLRKEIKQLEVELTKVEIGSKEFENLSDKLKDNKDKLELVRAKSRDLFDSFTMLPGPIGQIGSSISSTSDKLKIFTSFNLKDLKGQFKAVGDDIKLVAGNIGKATGITKLYDATVGGLSKAFTFFGVSTKAASTAAQGFGKALIATGIGAIVVLVGTLIANFDSFKKAILNLIPGLGKVADFIGGLVDSFTDLIGITNESERAEAARQATYEKAKVGTAIVNKGIERQIKLLEAQGASQEVIDELKKQSITNEINDLIKSTDKKGLLYGEQATLYKDLVNDIKVIDAEADKRKKDGEDAAAAKAKTDAKAAKATKDAKNKQSIQDEKQFLQSQIDAQVQLLKEGSDTNEKELRAALKKQFDLKNEGKKISVEVQKQQASEINKIVKDELAKDVEDRKKAYDDRIKRAQDFGKIELDAIDVDTEAKKIKYGEDSQEYRNAQQTKFDKQFELLTQEENILKEKEKTKDGLTNDEINRLKSIQNERGALTNTVISTNAAQIKSDLDKALNSAEAKKKETDDLFAENMRKAEGDLVQQQSLLEAKKALDEQYYAEQLAREGLNAEQIKAIKDKQLADAKANAEAQMTIEQKKFDAQQKLLMAIGAALNAVADIVGKNTKAGKSIAVAATLINTYAAIAGQLRASTASPGAAIPGYAIVQAIATGLVGFKAVADIIKTPIPNEGGGGGGTGASSGTAVPKPRGMATGGLVNGMGGPTSDLIPAMLSNGESVINAQSTSMFKPLLSSINAIGGGRRFADGGLAVGSFSQDQSLSQLQTMMNTQQVPIKTYVVASEMSNQQMMDRNIKTRSTV